MARGAARGLSQHCLPLPLQAEYVRLMGARDQLSADVAALQVGAVRLGQARG